MRIRGCHFRTGNRIDLDCVDGVIRAVSAETVFPADHEAQWVAPAFFDIQVNGCHGYSFNSAKLTVEQVRHVIETCRRHGITQLCPTLVTTGYEALVHGLTTVRKACETDKSLARAIPAVHVEGPYISPDDGPRGAHPREHVRPPCWDEFQRLQEAVGGRIRLITVAPEIAGALGFIERLVATGVVVAIGHTGASVACIRDAVAAGARLSTHLGNGAHAVLPRHPNYIWEQMADDRLMASVIADGHHLSASVLKCILRAKTPSRVILTCDASPFAGLPPGAYHDWGQEFTVLSEGKIIVGGTSFLAGSMAFTDHCLAQVLGMKELRLAEAVDMATARPRELLDLAPRNLQPGEPAEILLFDWRPGGEFRLVATYAANSIWVSRDADSLCD